MAIAGNAVPYVSLALVGGKLARGRGGMMHKRALREPMEAAKRLRRGEPVKVQNRNDVVRAVEELLRQWGEVDR